MPMAPRLNRWIAASALAVLGAASVAEQAEAFQLRRVDPNSTRRVALVIGIEKYGEGIGSLEYPVDDAQAFAQFLRDKWGYTQPEQVLLLTDDAADARFKPTQRNIELRVDDFLSRITPQHEVVVFYSGHGARSKSGNDYLVPSDGIINEDQQLGRTCISITELKGKIDNKMPRRRLLFVDACRNQLTMASAPERPPRAASAPFRGAAQAKVGITFDASPAAGAPGGVEEGAAEFFACKPNQRSRECLANFSKNGVFTHFLLAGLRGDPQAASEGAITYDTLIRYLREKVKNYVSATFSGDQEPYGSCTDGSLLLGRIPYVPAKMKPDTRLLVTDGYRALLAKNLEAARKTAHTILQMDADSWEAYDILGQVYSRQGELNQAISAFNTALKIRPEAPGIAESLAALLKTQKVEAPATLAKAALELARSTNQAQLREAEVKANQALAQDKRLPDAYTALGLVAISRSEFSKAVTYFTQAKEQGADSEEIRRGLALALLRQGEVDVNELLNEALRLVEAGRFIEAEPKAREVLERRRNDPGARMVMGLVYHSRGEYEKAILELRKALDVDPTLGVAREKLADANAKLELAESLRLAREAVQDADAGRLAEAEKKAQKVLKTDAQNAYALYALGVALAARKDFGGALTALQDAKRLAPSWGDVQTRLDEVLKQTSGSTDAAAVIAEARKALMQRDFRTAEVKAREVIGRDPRSADGHYVLGAVLLEARKFSEAQLEFQDALALKGAFPEAQAGLETAKREIALAASRSLTEESIRFLARGNPSLAAARASEALQADDRNALALAVSGYAEILIGDVSRGEQQVTSALKLDANLPLAHIARGHLLYSRAAQTEGDRQSRLLDDAITSYEKAARMLEGQNAAANGQVVLALNDLGALLLQRQKLDEAEPHLRKAVELAVTTQAQRSAPGEDIFLAAAHTNLGLVFLYRGDRAARDAKKARAAYEAAVDQYRAAIIAYPRNARSYADLGLALLKLDRRQEAEQAAREALSRGLREHPVFFELKIDPGTRRAARGRRASIRSRRE